MKPHDTLVQEHSRHGEQQCKDPKAIKSLPWAAGASEGDRTLARSQCKARSSVQRKPLLTFPHQI